MGFPQFFRTACVEPFRFHRAFQQSHRHRLPAVLPISSLPSITLTSQPALWRSAVGLMIYCSSYTFHLGIHSTFVLRSPAFVLQQIRDVTLACDDLMQLQAQANNLCQPQGCGVGVGVGVGVSRSRLFFPESESESESTKFTDSDRLRASSYSRFTSIAMPIILAFFCAYFCRRLTG